MLQASDQANYNGSGFAAHPKVVNQKNKFKDPYGGTQEYEYYPQNIMHDKRVCRGSTNAATIIPAGNYNDNIFQGSAQSPAKTQKANNQQNLQQAEEFFTRDVHTPEPENGRQNIDIQTDQFVEELTDKAPEYEIGCQTVKVPSDPPTPRQIPIKRGVDKKTLVEDNELFIFDREVRPLLTALCGKTLETAQMEVLEEEELRTMKEQQKHFSDLMKTELYEAQRMEQAEAKRKEEFERRKKNARDKRKNQILAHKKVICRQTAKAFLDKQKQHVYRYLRDTSYFVDHHQVDVLENNVMPWLYSKVHQLVNSDEDLNTGFDLFVDQHIKQDQTTHVKTVKDEHQRRADVAAQQEKERLQKEEEKRIRREKRAAKRKRQELRRLKAEINDTFIAKGEPREHMLLQDCENIDANHMKDNPSLCVFGGMLGQLIIAFNAISKIPLEEETPASKKMKQSKESKESLEKAEQEPTPYPQPAVDRLPITNFLFQFIDNKMKCEKFVLTVGSAVEDFLTSLEKPLALNEMRVMREPNYSNFRQLLSDPSQWGDEVLREMRQNCQDLGLDPKVFDMVYECFWDLYCKKSKHPDIGVKKCEGLIQRVKLQVPPRAPAAAEGEEEQPSITELPLKAIVRIRIPFLRPKKEGEEGEEGDESKQVEEEKKEEEEVKKEAENSEEEENTEDLEEVDIEDRAHCISTIGENYKIWGIHQAATRWVRRDMAKELKKTLPELQSIDQDDLLEAIEAESEAVEKAFLAMYKEGGKKQKEVPVFDFELN